MMALVYSMYYSELNAENKRRYEDKIRMILYGKDLFAIWIWIIRHQTDCSGMIGLTLHILISII